MFALIACAAFANNPLVAVQRQYPVSRLTITSPTASIVYYNLPRDAPPELRRAYKVLEIAERDVLLTEGLQLFKLEILHNERQLEALRTSALTTAYLSVNNPGYNSGPFFYGMPCYQGESTLRQYLAGSLGADASTERALLALDRLVDAQYLVHRTWAALAFPNMKFPEPQPRPIVPQPPAPVPMAGAFARGRLQPSFPQYLPPARQPQVVYTHVTPTLLSSAQKAVEEADRAERDGANRSRVAYLHSIDANTRYRYALPEEQATARRERDEAIATYNRVRNEWTAARQRSRAAHDRVLQLSRLPEASSSTSSLPVLAVRLYSPSSQPGSIGRP
ncbi:MAG TPA: hypothetical protein VLM40_20020 [Gemmata sp.]|nr:hypothetical protein [Gemmata sp.]